MVKKLRENTIAVIKDSKKIRENIADDYGFILGSGGTIQPLMRREKSFYFVAEQIPAQLRSRIEYISVVRRKHHVAVSIIKRHEKTYFTTVECPFEETEELCKVFIPEEFIVQLCLIL